jgi:hypothetical protein
MRRLIPDSLFGRISAVLVVGLVVTHFASTAIHYSDRDDALAMLGGGIVAERIATMARLLENASPEDRPWIVHATSRPGFRMSWDVQSALPASWRQCCRCPWAVSGPLIPAFGSPIPIPGPATGYRTAPGPA